MRIKVFIDNQPYDIEISKAPHASAPDKVIVNGEEISINVSKDWEREFPRSLIIEGKPYEVEFEYGEDGFVKRMWLNGNPCEVNSEFIGKQKLSKAKETKFVIRASGNSVISPMPGKIVKVLVKENQFIHGGELCIVLEAMKMENELEAPISGIVKKVFVKEGDLVDLDQLLISITEKEGLTT